MLDTLRDHGVAPFDGPPSEWSRMDLADVVAARLMAKEDEAEMYEEQREDHEHQRAEADRRRAAEAVARLPPGAIVHHGASPRGSAAIETPEIELDPPSDGMIWRTGDGE